MYGPETLEVALVLADMAAAYRGEEDLPEAEKAARRSLSIVEQKLGPEDANTALALDQLAEIYFDAHRYAEQAGCCAGRSPLANRHWGRTIRTWRPF